MERIQFNRLAAMLLLSSAIVMPVQAFAQSAGGSEADTQIGEIIVTAQRRAQNVQDVPIAITAISSEAIAETGIRDPRDLPLLVPSLSMVSGSAATATTMFIRGVGIGDFNPNNTGAIGIYVDDVFLGANSGKLFNVFDSAGIEVLKGPQGTLYGRNTTGGAIRFSSRKPTDDFTGDLSARYGRFNEVQLEGGVGGPLIEDKLKFRVAGTYLNRDGTTLNRVTGHKVNDMDMWAARGILDITPSPDVLLRVTVHGGRNSGGARQFQHRGQGVDFFGQPSFLPNGTPTDGFGYADTDNDIYAGDYDVEGKEKLDVFGVSLIGEFKLGGATLTSITAFERVDRVTIEDTDASPNNLITTLYEDHPRQFSQELRLQSDGTSNFNWIVGGFYFHDNLKNDGAFDVFRSLRDPSQPLDGFDPANSIGLLRYPYTQKTNSYALFGQADYKLTSALTATLGLRYSHDKIAMDYASFFDAVGTLYPTRQFSDVTVPIIDFKGEKSFDDLSWRAALNYKVGSTLVYASFSKGYNAGGFPGGSATDAAQVEPFAPEKLYAYELGLKTDLLDHKVRFNLNGFYYDYKDLQVYVLDLSGLLPIQRKVNAGSARIYGLEAELTVRPVRQIELFAAVTLLDTKYKDFGAYGYSGNRLVNAPSFATSGGISFEVPLGDAGSIKGRVDGTYVSSIFQFPDNSAIGKVDGYGLLNARLAWQSADKQYEMALWGKNLTGTKYITSYFPLITSDQYGYNDPRTYGVQAVIHF